MARVRQLVFAVLPSRLKAFALRLRGGQIGRGVRIGIGTVIDAKELVLGDHVTIGHQSFISCASLCIGQNSEVGSRVYFDLTRLSVGKDTRINDEVIIAGPRSPHSACTIGDRCILLVRSFINTAREVIVEDDVGIGNEAMIFTHGVWQSAFDGYPFSYAPVTLRKGCWIPARVFVMPGVEVGEGSTVGANSLVTRSLPDHVLAYGSPAKIASEPGAYPKRLAHEEKVSLLRQLAREFVEQLRFDGISVQETWAAEGFLIRTDSSSLRFATAEPPGAPMTSVELVLDGEPPMSGFWFHLGTKSCRLPPRDGLTERFELFARAYGVHFRRI